MAEFPDFSGDCAIGWQAKEPKSALQEPVPHTPRRVRDPSVAEIAEMSDKRGKDVGTVIVALGLTALG